MARTPRLVVIGGGSGGLAAARAARFRGAEVTLVQDGAVGGESVSARGVWAGTRWTDLMTCSW